MKWGQSKKAGTVLRSKQQLDHHQQEQEAEAEAAIVTTTCSSKTSWHKAATLRIQSTMLPFLLLVSMMVIPVPSFAGTHTLLPPFAPPTFPSVYKMYVHVCMCASDALLCLYVSLFCMWVCVYVHKSFVYVCVLVSFLLFFSCAKCCISVTKNMPLPLIQQILLEKIDQSHQSWWMLFLKLPDLDNKLEHVAKI
jgi:hypothetical protein